MQQVSEVIKGLFMFYKASSYSLADYISQRDMPTSLFSPTKSFWWQKKKFFLRVYHIVGVSCSHRESADRVETPEDMKELEGLE